MKTLFIITALCVLSFAVRAQQFRNNTTCTLRLTSVCYDPSTCLPMPPPVTCGGTVHVAPSSTVALPGCTNPCTGATGYMIAYGPGTNCNVYTLVGDSGTTCAANYPVSNTLPPCPGCGNVTRTASYIMVGGVTTLVVN